MTPQSPVVLPLLVEPYLPALQMFVRLIQLIFVMALFSGSAIAQSDDDWKYFVGGYLTATAIDAKTTSFAPCLLDRVADLSRLKVAPTV